MTNFQILILLSVFLAVIYAYDDYDYQDDYDPRPYRGRRPSYSQHRRDGGGYGGVYGGGGRDRGRGPQYYRFSFGSKEKAKTVGTGEGQVNFLGHRARFNRERIRNKDVEAGGQWGGVNLSPGAKVWLANYA